MAFSDSIVRAAWTRSGGRCECQRTTCGHTYTGRCTQYLKWNERGNDSSIGGWEAHHITAQAAGGADTLSNCQILCMRCHKNTRTYGK